ncbi:MAG: hypothetical protein GX418_11890 [Clostridiales bacterium]|nr:hypothetical protein [Clostridiales bacterium]
MQQFIDNRLYDTETAKPMGNWQRGFSSERGYISETLYQTPEGEYFLHGEGGPRSRYAQRTAPNTWGYGERLIPFSNEEAHEWAENHLTEDAVHTAFVKKGYDGCMTPMMIHLRCGTAEKLTRLAAEQGRQPSELAEEMIAKGLSAE